MLVYLHMFDFLQLAVGIQLRSPLLLALLLRSAEAIPRGAQPEVCIGGTTEPLGAEARGLRPLRRRLAAVEVPAVSSLEVVLSTEKRAPIEWDLARITYSLTVPSEAVAAAISAVANPAYDGVTLTLHWPDDGRHEVLQSGVPSAFVDIPTEEAARFVLEVSLDSYVMLETQATNYTISVLRSTISSLYEFAYPDPAESALPQQTLAGLQVLDLYGVRARMKPFAFEPMRSQYLATVAMEMQFAFVIASKNDPAALLSIRVDGQDWADLDSGVNSDLLVVPERGWLLLEIRVSSPMAIAKNRDALIYQVAIFRGLVCHERCRTCYGPTEADCLSCRAPLVLSEGHCDATACPPNGYYEWESYQCRRCDPSCAQCEGPGSDVCTLCPALHFLSPVEFEDAHGPCVIQCPIGKFAHPQSRRCRRPPAVIVKTFYLQFSFRVAAEDETYDTRLQRSILNATAFVLGLSLSDVRAYRMELGSQALVITMEVMSPFLPKSDADKISIDLWFGAFEIPVDKVVSLTWDSVHPPVAKLPVDPLIPYWLGGIIVSLATGLLIICPMYFCFFRRLNNTRKKYVQRVGVDPIFMDLIVHQSPAWLIRRFMAHESGEKNHITKEED